MQTAKAIGVTHFHTAIGRCGLGWGPHGVVAIRLSDGDDRLARKTGAERAAPPPHIIAVIEGITALLAGQNPDLSAVALDMSRLPDFDRGVYELTRAIPRGATRTYGDLAKDLGDRLFAQQVGQALSRNPFPIVVPCHRVVGAGEKLVGFSAPGGIETKRRILAIEGVFPGGGPTLFDHYGIGTV